MSSVESKGDRRDRHAIKRLIGAYLRQLRERPVITKACTSAVVSAISDIVAQKIIANGKDIPIQWRSVVAFSSFGFVVTGPLIHHFYKILEQVVPKDTEYAGVKKVLIDRLLLAPPYLLLLFYIVPILEGKGHHAAVTKIRESFMPALIMNVKVWTILQYININYVPIEYRVLYGNTLALFWNIYLAMKRR